MTPPIDELMRVVRYAVQPYREHREYEDIYSEALIHAWEVLQRPGWCRWTTIAWKAASFQAREYLRKRRSGRLTGRWVEPVFPVWLEEVAETEGTDGGIDAADARLQLWLWDQPLPATETNTCGICGAPLPKNTGGRRRDYCGNTCKWRQRVRKKREGESCP